MDRPNRQIFLTFLLRHKEGSYGEKKRKNYKENNKNNTFSSTYVRQQLVVPTPAVRRLLSNELCVYVLSVFTFRPMPPIRRGRSNLGRRTRNATNQANFQSHRTSQQREERNELERIRISQSRATRRVQTAFTVSRAAFSYDVSIDYSSYQCI